MSRQHAEVRRQVGDLFSRSRAFSSLSPEQQDEIRRNTEDIIETMAANEVAQAASADPYAVPMGPGDPASPLSPGLPGTSGGQTPQFTGGVQPGSAEGAFGPKEQGDFGTAIATGVGQAGALLRQVNFPAFVAELVQGVFQAVVDASIQQMQAYGELVQSVVMSLNQFRDQNVSENQARDHLVGKFPQLMQINISEDGPRVGVRPGAEDLEIPDLGKALGMNESITELDEDLIEEKLVPAARNELARSRQSLLATMLLMGINRIVVTDGKISAKLKFDFRARDTYTRNAQTFDYENFGTTKTSQASYESESSTGENYESSGFRSGRFASGSRSGESSRWSQGSYQTAETPAIYLTSIEDETTGGELSAKASLAGSVSLNFKSETFDLNKLTTAGDVFRLHELSPAGAGRGAPAPGVTPPATTATTDAAPPPAQT